MFSGAQAVCPPSPSEASGMQDAAHATPLVFKSPAPSTDTAAVYCGGPSDEYHQLEKQLAEWFIKLSIHEQWSKCRLQNSRGSAETHVLRPLLTTANRIPYLFPPTLADLRCLDMATVLALLRAYEQDVPPDIELDAARRALARFIGAPAY
ncbi:hypothetical protein B0H11DRAFT_155264 [Mycena galericulata]|nr:hypothetical protein B0H11DRAFT_155264 [Mycena galericulata]